MDSNFAVTHERLAHLYADLGRFNEAIAEESKARTLTGEDEDTVRSRDEALRHALATHGAVGYWQTQLRFATSRPNPPEAYDDAFGIAVIYAQLGEKEKAINSLESTYAERTIAMTEIGVEPAFDALRSEPRFQDLLRRVGLLKP